jgi:hypothetical protein
MLSMSAGDEILELLREEAERRSDSIPPSLYQEITLAVG